MHWKIEKKNVLIKENVSLRFISEKRKYITGLWMHCSYIWKSINQNNFRNCCILYKKSLHRNKDSIICVSPKINLKVQEEGLGLLKIWSGKIETSLKTTAFKTCLTIQKIFGFCLGFLWYYSHQYLWWIWVDNNCASYNTGHDQTHNKQQYLLLI